VDVISALEGLGEDENVEPDDEDIDFGQFVPKAGTEASEE
jgi:hypothetical protein